MIYRGQANHEWEITSSAYRELKKNMNDLVTPSLLKEYHDKLIDGARRLHDISLSNEDDITILSHLQHNKAKTILIDYTYNPLAALWFACTDKTCDNVDGCVYAVEESFTHNIFPLKNNDLDFLFKSTEIAYIYHPYQINQRIINQQSVFLIRWLGKIDKSQQIQIIVPSKKKNEILQELQVLGVTRKTLFPDFIGYIDTFEYDTDNKSICNTIVVSAREIMEGNKPNYSDAKSLLNDALELTSTYDGTEDRAYILHELGYISYRLNAFDDALKYYNEAIKEKNKFLEDDSFGIMYTETAKGLTYIKRGEYSKALPIFEKARKSLLLSVEKNPYIAYVFNNIANTYREMGLYESAKEMAEEAEDIARTCLGTESKDYAYIINCLGSVYAKINKEKEAYDMFEKALRIFKQSYSSEDNLDVVYTYLKIASLYDLKDKDLHIMKKTNCLDKAIEILERMAKDKDNVSVKRCFAYAYTINAKYCNLSGDYDKAIELCKKAIKCSESFGKNHPKMYDTNIAYGEALYSKKRYEDSLKYYQMACEGLKTVNEKHPEITKCQERIDNIIPHITGAEG
jgi:tetratricopeptide (TPR) repeat protein